MLYIFCSELEVHGRGWSFSGAGYGLYKTHTHKRSREDKNSKATWSDLFTLTKSDLKEELGIAKLANRKLLFEALGNLRDHDTKPYVPLQPMVRAGHLLTSAIGGRGHAWWGIPSSA